ncbi:MAG: hypothetical protein K2X93_25540 [Candidatus Obscuribacterales bacterium]|nr:hypothetical protein [Candidatus Obscuribacterales bacterium]
MVKQATKETTVATKQRGKVETADTYLGLASKILTIVAALTTLFVWLYSTFYFGSVEIRPDKDVSSLNVTLFDERGIETVYHTEKLKVAPGRYQIIVESDGKLPTKARATVRFNGTTIVPYSVIDKPTPAETPVAEESPKDSRKWWQIWKRN